MANDNTLGAPTEGLGQTVTFAASGGAGVPQAPVARRGAIRNEFRGGQAQRANVATIAPAKKDPTAALLMKMGEAIIAPHLEEERTAKYLEGMQAVAEGQVIADIVDEQPWYSKMFGATPLVDGARAYTAFTKAQEVGTAFEAEMPELRKLSGKEFAAEAARRMMGARTGDATTDMMVASQLTKSLPQKMATQAKQHYLFQQETMVNAQRSALQSAMSHAHVLGTKYRATDASAVPGDAYMPGAENTDRGEQLAAQLSVVEAAQRPDGMDPKLHSRNLTDAVLASMAEGNLDGAYTLFDAGVLKDLDPAHQRMLVAGAESAERKLRANLPAGLVQEIAEFKNAEYTDDPEGIVQRAGAINAKFAALTGAREGLLGGSDVAMTLAAHERIAMQRMELLQRQRAAAREGQEKADAHLAVVQEGAGRILALHDPAGMTDKEVQQAWNMLADNPDQGAVFIARAHGTGTGNIDKTFQTALRGNIQRALANTDAALMHDTYTKQYLPLVQAGGERGEAAAAIYVGEQFGRAMADYHAARQGRVGKDADSEETRVMALQLALSPPPKPLGDTKQDKAFKDAARTGTFSRIVNNLFMQDAVNMSKETEDHLAEYLAPAMRRSGLAPEQAFEAALAQARVTNLTVLGGAFWKRGPGETDLQTYLKNTAGDVMPTEANRATRMAFDAALKEQGLEDGGATIQLPDRDGVPVLMVMGTDAAGAQRWAVVTGSDIRSRWVASKAVDMMAPAFTPMP